MEEAHETRADWRKMERRRGRGVHEQVACVQWIQELFLMPFTIGSVLQLSFTQSDVHVELEKQWENKEGREGKEGPSGGQRGQNSSYSSHVVRKD